MFPCKSCRLKKRINLHEKISRKCRVTFSYIDSVILNKPMLRICGVHVRVHSHVISLTSTSKRHYSDVHFAEETFFLLRIIGNGFCLLTLLYSSECFLEYIFSFCKCSTRDKFSPSAILYSYFSHDTPETWRGCISKDPS